MGWLQGNVSLVTGGGSGIGLAVVRRFLKEGASGVGVLVKDPDQADLLRDEFADQVEVIIGDVRSAQDNDMAVKATVGRFGHLDTLVANAGVWDFFAGIKKYDLASLDQAFDEIFSVNVKGYLLAAAAAREALVASRGSIIMTLSNSSFYAGGGGPLYVASKHAGLGLVRQLAYELAPEVRVNGVAPGGTVTPLKGLVATGKADVRLDEIQGFQESVANAMPLKMMAQPEDHTAHYVLLASKENSPATTAHVIQSDGGWEIRGFK
jgi:NAD(P)-dependent dehydrogenase (short-subunit alcohol dehydrogenase family)